MAAHSGLLDREYHLPFSCRQTTKARCPRPPLASDLRGGSLVPSTTRPPGRRVSTCTSLRLPLPAPLLSHHPGTARFPLVSLTVSVRTAKSFSTASRWCPGETRLYRSVLAIVLCPRSPLSDCLSQSSDLPRPVVSEHGIQDGEELPHGGGDRDLVGTARGDEAAKERPDHGVVPDRRDRGHVQAASDVRTTADNHPPATEGAAISGHRRQPGEGGNAPAIQVAKFRRIGDQRARRDGPHAGNGAQQFVGFSPDRVERIRVVRSASRRSRASSSQAM